MGRCHSADGRPKGLGSYSKSLKGGLSFLKKLVLKKLILEYIRPCLIQAAHPRCLSRNSQNNFTLRVLVRRVAQLVLERLGKRRSMRSSWVWVGAVVATVGGFACVWVGSLGELVA